MVGAIVDVDATMSAFRSVPLNKMDFDGIEVAQIE